MQNLIKVRHSRIRLPEEAKDSYRRCTLYVLPVLDVSEVLPRRNKVLTQKTVIFQLARANHY